MGNNALDTLFSTVRREVLVAFLLHSKKSWYLSELMRHLDRAASQLHRELSALTEIGLLVRRVEGRQTYFTANEDCSYLEELKSLLQKLVGVEASLKTALGPYAKKIVGAFMLPLRSERSDGARGIKLVVISDLKESVLIREVEQVTVLLGQAISLELHRVSEVARKGVKTTGLKRDLLARKKVFIVGSADEIGKLLKTASRKSNTSRCPKK